jgi:FkbM family methyltransferase
MANPLLSLAAAAARWLPAPLKRALYRMGPASSGLRTVLNRAAPQGLSEVEVAGGALAGARLMLDLQAEKDYWLGTYEMELQNAIGDFARPGMVAYDLGANIGYISLLLAQAVRPNGKVFAFEALPNNQERLRNNLSLNSDLNVELIAKAVTDKTAPVQFLVHASGGMGKMAGANGRTTKYENSITANGISIDDFVFAEGNPSPNLIKMDIEGGEGIALRGMSRVMRELRPLFTIELHGKEAAKSCWDQLTQSGYGIYKLAKGYPRISSLNDLSWKSYILAKAQP